ncbi:hypothetical protein AGMMS50225_11990 [Betaproteobacteria bacterium]|nr:hypothetical protein AGMMS50225_11990 [Betaproteobacteria bacterium]
MLESILVFIVQLSAVVFALTMLALPVVWVMTARATRNLDREIVESLAHSEASIAQTERERQNDGRMSRRIDRESRERTRQEALRRRRGWDSGRGYAPLPKR